VRTVILMKKNGPVATVAIDRPQTLNTMTPEVIHRLTKAFDELEGDPATRLIILTGSGDKAFIGGVDVHTFVGLDRAGAEKFISDLHGLIRRIRESQKIVIAAINGFVLGGGLEVAAACDLRIASERARFGMPEVKVGIPSVIEAALLPKLIGLGRTQELIYLGEMITAAEAKEIGLVNRVVAPEKLEEETLAMAEKVLANGPAAIRLQKKLIAEWMELPLSWAVQAGIGAFGKAFDTTEPREGCEAFLQKRPPSFKP
jgi:enoyl-CoA hydratase